VERLSLRNKFERNEINEAVALEVQAYKGAQAEKAEAIALKKLESADRTGKKGCSMTFDILMTLVTNTDAKLADTYLQWAPNSWSIMRCCRTNKFSLRQEIEVVHAFSKINDNYDEQRVDEFISKGIPECENPKTIASLKAALRESKPELYDDLFGENSSDIEGIVDTILYEGITHQKVALILRQLFPSYIYTGNERLYYKNENGIYKKMDVEVQTEQFMNKINGDVKKAVETCFRAKSSKGEKTSKFVERNIKAAKLQLDTLHFKKSCVKAFMSLMLNTEAEGKFNTIRHIIACDNGVYDLKERVFRNATPEEYFSLSTNFTYYPESFEYVDKLVDTVYPSKATSRHVKKLLGRTLEGGNPDQKAYFFHGAGSNGKSMINALMMAGLGD
jgi:hypothetical protein